MDDLRREMVVSCEPKRMNISFPKSLAEKLNVKVISLNDPACKSESNSTHVWLTTHITSCNTLSSSEYDKTVYTYVANSVPELDFCSFNAKASTFIDLVLFAAMLC
jgi:Zona pellucida-like domain